MAADHLPVIGLPAPWLVISERKRLMPTCPTHPEPSQLDLPLPRTSVAILSRAAEILGHAAISDGERQVRLQVVRAALTGRVIRPSDESPEIRNPAYWILVNDRFVVAPGVDPIAAIEDLWVLHGADGVPIPRIRCLKFTTLILIQGLIQHFRTTDNGLGLTALNQFLRRRVIPEELPKKGDGILWDRHFDADRLLPGDQVWFDNPFFHSGRELLREQFQQDALHAGKSPEEAASWAQARAKAVTAGEEGSNAFALGDDHFILGADSLVRGFRGPLYCDTTELQPRHELVFTHKIFSLARFQEHMIEDNFSVQATLRANSDTVDPGCFTIERIRAPLDPDHLFRHHAAHPPTQDLRHLITAVASRNPPPTLEQTDQSTVPVFPADYDWDEQERVRLALDDLLQADPDANWWHLRDSIDDERYVLTASRGHEVQNFTVGMLCGDLADARLCLCFTRRLPLVPGCYPASFQPERLFLDNEARWRAAEMPLFAMQSALCEAALREWDHIVATEPGEDGRYHRFSAEEKSRYVTAIRAEIAELTQTRRAACDVVILPCHPAPVGWEGFDADRATASDLFMP